MPSALGAGLFHTDVTTTALASETTQDRVGVTTGYRLLWLAVIFDILALRLRVGRRWHATHPFEDFFSPPHLFVCSLHLCATLTLAYIAFTPDLRPGSAPRSPYRPSCAGRRG